MGTHLVAALAVVALAACLESSTSTCGPLICPAERACDPHRVTCVVPAQLEACAGIADGEPCSYPGTERGVCDHGACHPAVCGDGFTAADEVCDDGNLADGDGCSARCDSDERCGNGVVDLPVGEACDDGNLASSDGCTSRCAVEVAVWHESVFTTGATGLHGAEMAYDAARDRVVLFGGVSPTGVRLDQTWELLAGAQWSLRPSGAPPPGRDGHVLIYDPVRAASVLFGGLGAGDVLLDDVWTYDGTWRPLVTGPGPTARAGAGGAYLAGRLVVFGGADAAGVSGETWELAGAQWTRRDVAGPPARRDHRMAHDAGRGRVVLFGGSDGVAELTDTWEWDGDRWTRVETATTIPTARGAMTWHATRRRIVLMGGGAAVDGSTWELESGDWRRVVGIGPSPRRRAAMTYDALRRQIVLRGGTARPPGMLGPALADTWRYDGAWTPGPTLATAPPEPRNFAGFAYDPVHRQLVVAAGFRPPNVARTDTAVFDGTQWLRAGDVATWSCAFAPGVFCTSRMVHETATGHLLLVRRQGAELQTWRFDGRAWARVPTMTAPPARELFALAYDQSRGRAVLFGGGGGGSDRGDTWELDGDRWIETTPAVSPSPRQEPAMIYDEGRRAVILFGGNQAGMPTDDTWSYDGQRWSEVAVDVRPPRRQGAGIAYHRARGRVIVFGGDQPPTPLTDLWELSDDGWREIVVFEGPDPRRSPHLTYDAERDLVVLHGGDPRTDTWELRFRSVQPVERCWAAPAPATDDDGDGLVDCADPDCADAACDHGKLCAGGACTCAAGAELRCGDGADDDCDGQVDCADGDCASTSRCGAESQCADGRDDDGDGLVDCADPGCVGLGLCEARETSCADGADNDGDARVDCADVDCFLRGCTEVP